MIRSEVTSWIGASLLVAVVVFAAPTSFGQLDNRDDQVLPAANQAEVLEPDYAIVAADARKIADEIEKRLIQEHMTDASSHLFDTDAVAGYPKVKEAYLDMEEMISFCEATAGGAGSACRFNLKMSMSMNPGATLGQFGRGMNPGSGLFGNSGQGSSGSSGARTPFGVFGPESFGDKSRLSTRLGPKKTRSAGSAPVDPDPLAGNVEELDASKNFDLDVSAESGEQILAEYRRLIEAYFKRIAEQE